MSGSCSQYSRKSLPERSALSPIETNDDSPIPRAAASSIAAIPNAPLWEANATLPGVGAPGSERRVERAQVVEVGDAEAVRADHAHAGGPADGEQLILARAALGADLGEARRQDDERADALGRALARGLDDRAPPAPRCTASSTSPSTSAMLVTVGRPATSPPRALTRCSGPE